MAMKLFYSKSEDRSDVGKYELNLVSNGSVSVGIGESEIMEKRSLCSTKECSDQIFSEQLVSEYQKQVCGERMSHLTLSQYSSMSGEQRSRINNRVRQWALKARNCMPSDNQGLFVLVAAHLLKNAHRYFNMEKPSDLQMNILSEKTVSDDMKQKILQDFKETNKTLRVINNLKESNRIEEQQELVSKMKGDSTFRDLSFISGVPLKTVHKWCSLPKQKEHKASELANL